MILIWINLNTQQESPISHRHIMFKIYNNFYSSSLQTSYELKYQHKHAQHMAMQPDWITPASAARHQWTKMKDYWIVVVQIYFKHYSLCVT
jgi:hypothetical protein